ncbi:MAG: phosphodiester glycosidase family protein [Oscillospiraceae bacterium]|nr:phosphodiester glycosidase family protein [Oscillospiraceae bacterium]
MKSGKFMTFYSHFRSTPIKKLLLLFFVLFLLTGCESAKEDGAGCILFEQDDFTIIKTKAENIKPETIRSPICSDYIRDLGYYGINAGFFNTIYREKKPADDEFVSVSISWSKDDAEKGLEVCEFSIRDPERVALGEGPYIARGTLFLCINDEAKYEAGVITAESCGDVRAQRGDDCDYIYMIGGGNFYLGDYPGAESWEKWKNEKYLEEGPLVIENTKTGRSGIGIKNENGIWYVYLVCSGTNGREIPKTLEELRALFVWLECSEAIYLDGAGSSQMRFAYGGELTEKPGDNRYIWAMVRLLDD